MQSFSPCVGWCFSNLRYQGDVTSGRWEGISHLFVTWMPDTAIPLCLYERWITMLTCTAWWIDAILCHVSWAYQCKYVSVWVLVHKTLMGYDTFYHKKKQSEWHLTSDSSRVFFFQHFEHIKKKKSSLNEMQWTSMDFISLIRKNWAWLSIRNSDHGNMSSYYLLKVCCCITHALLRTATPWKISGATFK